MSDFKIILGITGPSGAGKSALSSALARNFNAQVICADKIAREVIDEKVLSEIRAEFGRDVLENGELNRQKLGKIVFENAQKREKLNAIIWPRVIKKIESEIAKSVKNTIIIDVPMLFESGLDKICNKTIAVLADENLRLERIMNRDKISQTDAKRRMNAQPNYDFYKSRADFVIINDGDENNLTKKFEEWYKSCKNL